MLMWWPMQHGRVASFLTTLLVAIEWPHVHSIAKFKQLTTKNCCNDSMVTKSVTIIWWQPNWSQLFDGDQINHSYLMAIKNGKGRWLKTKKVNNKNVTITIQWQSNQNIQLQLPFRLIFSIFSPSWGFF
jgi:hypothetical protein